MRRHTKCLAPVGVTARLIIVSALLGAITARAQGEELADTGWAVGKPPTLGPDGVPDETTTRFRVTLDASKLKPRGGAVRSGSGGHDLWRPTRTENEGAQRIARNYDWASSALSDFSLQNGRPRPPSNAEAANERGLVVEIRPEADEIGGDGIEFRSPGRPEQRDEAASGPPASKPATIEPERSTNEPNSDSSTAESGRRPVTAERSATEGATSTAKSNASSGQRRQAADRRPLDSSELDRLLKSWDTIAQEQTGAPQQQAPQPGPSEPRAFDPNPAGAATPIDLPEDDIELKRSPAPRQPARQRTTATRDAEREKPSSSRSPQRDPETSKQPQTEVLPKQSAEQHSTRPEPTVEPAVLRPLSRGERQLRDKVRNVLRMYYRRPLNSRDHDPWEMMHGMLAFGVHSRVLQNGPTGKPITAVGWLCYNKPCKQKTLLYTTPEGELRARWGVGVQGHYGQFLAMLAQCRVSRDYPIRVGSQEFTINDLIEAEKVTCRSGEELTFKLIALMHYCPSDERWLDDQGGQWDIRRLVREELQQPIRGAPCGGTHRLAGLALAARTRVKRDEPLDGEFREAHDFYKRYQRYAFQFQNSDGSLSTNWFRGPGSEEDINRRIKTSGHILEWLLYSLEDEELHDRRVYRAVNYVATLMANNYHHDWEIGPLCHATHALVIYDERLLQKYDALEESDLPIAEQPGSQRNVRRTTRRATSR